MKTGINCENAFFRKYASYVFEEWGEYQYMAKTCGYFRQQFFWHWRLW